MCTRADDISFAVIEDDGVKRDEGQTSARVPSEQIGKLSTATFREAPHANEHRKDHACGA